MNQSIAKHALVSVLGGLNAKIDVLLEIINQLPNPEIGVELMLGTYRLPEIPRGAKDSNNEIERCFISFDKFKEEVTYSYRRVRRKDGWFLRGVEQIEENCKSTKWHLSEVAKELNASENYINEAMVRGSYILEIETDKYQNTMRIENWLREANSEPEFTMAS